MNRFENLENQILPEYTTARHFIEKKDYVHAKPAMKSVITQIETALSEEKGRMFSFNHIVEVYYFRFFPETKEKPLTYAPFNVGAFYRLYGYLLIRLEEYKDAITAYENALDWNPTDLDSLFQLSELYKKTKDLKNTREITLRAYNYCSSRATMAHFYRNLGFYYLESYQPETATALYLYSSIFAPSESAARDLDYLAKALKRPTPELSIAQMQEILKQNHIPAGPNPDTVGITFRTGQLEMENGHYDTARDCFTLVYDLTLDKEAKELLEQLPETE